MHKWQLHHQHIVSRCMSVLGTVRTWPCRCFCGWWKADQTLLWFRPCQGVASTVFNEQHLQSPAEMGVGSGRRERHKLLCLCTCHGAWVTPASSREQVEFPWLVARNKCLFDWQTKQMSAAVTWNSCGPTIWLCKAHSGTQSTPRNNSRSQNSEFLQSFLTTNNSNHFKTTGREQLRAMTHPAAATQRSSCLSGRQEATQVPPEPRASASSLEKHRAHQLPLTLSFRHQPRTRRDPHPQMGWAASPDPTNLQRDGAEGDAQLKRVPKTPGDFWFWADPEQEQTGCRFPTDGPACTTDCFKHEFQYEACCKTEQLDLHRAEH